MASGDLITKHENNTHPGIMLWAYYDDGTTEPIVVSEPSNTEYKKIIGKTNANKNLLYFKFLYGSYDAGTNYIKNFQIEKNTEVTDFEPYTGETITVTNDTESPAFGLKSHKGLTHIISPGNVKCVYPTNESGVSVLEKERQLNDNKSDVVIDKSTGNKVVFTIENGIICAREA